MPALNRCGQTWGDGKGVTPRTPSICIDAFHKTYPRSPNTRPNSESVSLAHQQVDVFADDNVGEMSI
jgi:hypothetical protein